MQRQSIVAYGEPLQATTADTPSPTGKEIVIKVHHCGVCHSDIHMQDGYFNLGRDKQLDVRAGRELPFTLGHEIEGEVAAIGPDADQIKVGDHYAVYPWIGCGTCDLCLGDEEIFCARAKHLGITVDGGFATHVVVPDAKYLLDVSGIDPAFAGTCMCSGLTALSALKKLVDQTGKLLKGPIMIIGLGGVGMIAVEIAKAIFDTPPFVADIDASKRQAALELGASEAFDSADRAAIKAAIKKSGGGVSGSVDFAGAEGSVKFGHSVLRKGGKLVIAGLIGGHFEIAIPMFPLRSIGIQGSFVGTLDEAKELLDMVRAGKINPMAIEKRPLDAANKSLDDLRNGKIIGRVVLTP